jgi:integrase
MPRAVWSKCLPAALWPPADRAAWAAVMVPGDVFNPGGLASSWSDATRRKTALGWGRYLLFLKERGELDEAVGPAARITRERLTAYLEEIRRTNRGHTIHCRIQELGDALRAMAPEHDWGFIQRAAGRLRAATVPAWSKGGRIPPLSAIIAQGWRMMQDAEERGDGSALARAALFRDGLLLVFLAYHPLRLRNLSALRLGHHLVVMGARFILTIDGSETKGRQGIEQEVAPRLAAALRRYVDHYRPILLKARGRWHARAADELWISRDGSPCSPETLQNIIAKHTSGRDGRPLSPHLFRSMAGTALAVEAPGDIDVVPAVLGHGSAKTAEKHYNVAGSLEASRDHGRLIDDLREQLVPRRRRRPIA